MDLRALMQKLETINTKQIVNESVETKQVITESVAAPVRKSADPVFTSSIARGLVEEFGYELDEAPVTSGSGAPVTSGSGAPVQSGTAAPAADAAAAAKAKLSPEQLKWLGGADPTDPFIMARLKKAVPDAPGATTPSVMKPAPGGAGTKPTDPAAAPAVAPGGVQAMGDDDGNTMITKPDGTVQVVGPDGKPLANGGKVDTGAATKPSATGTPPAGGAGGDAAVKATREKLTALLDKLEKTGGVSGSAPAPAAPAPAPKKPATGAATKPAAPAAGNSVDWNAIGAGQMTAESSYADDQTLLAIKNIRY